MARRKGRADERARRMRIVAQYALNAGRVILRDDLRLLNRAADNLFVAERADGPCIARYGQLQVGRMNRAGGRIDIVPVDIAPATRSVADLALDDFAERWTIVNSGRPGGVLSGVARSAELGALIFRLVVRN